MYLTLCPRASCLSCLAAFFAAFGSIAVVALGSTVLVLPMYPHRYPSSLYPMYEGTKQYKYHP